MKIHELQQGTQEWHDLRARHFTASEAPVMMGSSKYQRRSELLRQKKTGDTPEIDAAKQRLFDAGHAAEAAARPFAESVVGEELFPVTCTAEIDGLPLLASLDGLTMDESTVWEHKLWNDSLANQISQGNLDAHYYWQLEHQLLVTGAERMLFMATSENQEAAEYCWYTSDPALRARLIAGWKQFAADLAAWTPPAVEQEVIAAPVEGFGALVLQVEGRVVSCNLDAFKAGAQAFLERLPKPADLQTDADFATAENAVKACAETEARIKAAKDAALAQMADVDAVLRMADTVSDSIRSARLSLDKAVKAQKDTVRFQKITAATQAFAAHVESLQVEIYNVRLNPPQPDFGSAIRGLKTISSVQDKLDTALRNGKLAADAMAKDYRAKLAYFDKAAVEHKALFADLQSIIVKPEEDFRMTVAHRINQHEAAEERRLDAERARIRAEEEAKAKAEAEAKLRAKQQAAMPAVPLTDPTPQVTAKPTTTARPSTAPAVSRANPAPTSKSRPSDDEIIDVLALHFRVHESAVVAWLLEIDLEAASQRIADSMAG